MIFSNLLLLFLFYTRFRSLGLIWIAFSLSCFLKARSKHATLQGKEKLPSLLKLSFARQLVHFGPPFESAHPSAGRVVPPSLVARQRGDPLEKKNKTLLLKVVWMFLLCVYVCVRVHVCVCVHAKEHLIEVTWKREYKRQSLLTK